MSTERYPRLTATEALLSVAGDVVSAGVKLKALLVDAEFTTRLGLRSLKAAAVSLYQSLQDQRQGAIRGSKDTCARLG